MFTTSTWSTGAEAQPLFSCCTFFSNCECQSESLLVYCNVKHLLLIQISSLHYFSPRQCAVHRCVCARYNTYKPSYTVCRTMFVRCFRIGSIIFVWWHNMGRERSSHVGRRQLLTSARDNHAQTHRTINRSPSTISLICSCRDAFRVSSNNFLKRPLRSAIGITFIVFFIVLNI